MDSSDISKKLHGALSALGVDVLGIAGVASLGARNREAAEHLLPGARTVVVVGLETYGEVLDHAIPGKKLSRAAMSDLLESHTDFLNTELNRAVYAIAAALHRLGLRALPLPARGLPFDNRRIEAPFSYKDAAQAAGLGGIGRHSLLISPQFGPRLRFACCLTNAELPPGAPASPHDCGDCRACIDGCPVKALAMPEAPELYKINKSARAAGGGTCRVNGMRCRRR